MKKRLSSIVAFTIFCALIAGCTANTGVSNVSTNQNPPSPSASATEKMLGKNEPFSFEDGDIIITNVDENSKYSSEYVKSNERTIAVTVKMAMSAMGNQDFLDNVILKPSLKNMDNTEYELVMNDTQLENGDIVITFLFVLPDNTALNSLTFWMNGEGRELS